jgi:hypothetical protein
MGAANGWGTFPKESGAGLSYCLILGPLFWECPYPRALPYTTKKNAGLVVRGKMVLKQITPPKEYLDSL